MADAGWKPDELSPDEVVGGRYRVIRELGRGGMGCVYEAENLRTGRRVALKTMRDDPARREEMRGRFEREARAAGQLRHPSVVEVLDVGDDEARGMTFIVHELLDGGDLARCLRTAGPLAPRVALATLLPVVDALAAAHARSVVHRDLKPDNIFLHEGPDGVVPKLIDFGIATVAGDASHTATGEVVGSPSYASPEQARGDGDVDAQTDVWSLGMVFYKCLSMSVAYSAPTASVLLAKIIYEEPTPLATLAPHLPRDLVAAVQRAVTKDRSQRWPSMAAFGEALRACDAWRGVDATRARRWVANARGEAVETATEEAVVAPGAMHPRGSRLVWPAALATTVLVMLAALWPAAPTRRERRTVMVATPTVAVATPERTPIVEEAPTIAPAEEATPRRAARATSAPRRLGAAQYTRGYNGSPIIP